MLFRVPRVSKDGLIILSSLVILLSLFTTVNLTQNQQARKSEASTNAVGSLCPGAVSVGAWKCTKKSYWSGTSGNPCGGEVGASCVFYSNNNS